MFDTEANEIMDRLNQIERKMRRYQTVLVGVAFIAVAGAVAQSLSSRAAKTIQAKAFQVVDDARVVRAALGTTSHGTALTLRDKTGNQRAILTVVDNGT